MRRTAPVLVAAVLVAGLCLPAAGAGAQEGTTPPTSEEPDPSIPATTVTTRAPTTSSPPTTAPATTVPPTTEAPPITARPTTTTIPVGAPTTQPPDFLPEGNPSPDPPAPEEPLVATTIGSGTGIAWALVIFLVSTGAALAMVTIRWWNTRPDARGRG